MVNKEEEQKFKKISMANTKKEMLAAYNELLEQSQEKEKAELKPKEKMAEKKNKEAVEITDSLSSEGVMRGTSSLKLEIGKMLTQLSEKLEERVAEYQKVKEAIQVKKAELQEIYEIEKVAHTLTALMEAQSQKKKEFEEEMRIRKEELEQEIQRTQEEWENKKRIHDTEVKDQRAEEKKKLEREREEYAYTFKREQQLARDKFEDEKAKLDKELYFRKESLEKELAEREKAISQKEEEFNELRKKVETFPKEMDLAVNKTIKETQGKLQVETESKEGLLRKTFEGERNVLQTKIEVLEKKTKEQSEQIAKLLQQLEAAYQKVQDVAVKAVGGVSDSKPLADLQQFIVREIKQQTGKEK
jgi:hypothetical protein